MHGFTDIVIATERERKVTYSTTDMRTGKVFLNPSGSFNEVYRIVVMFFESRSYGEHIGVEDNIMGIKIDFVDQQAVCTLAHLYLAGGRIRLTFFVKSHYDSGSSVLFDSPGMFEEYFFPFFQRNRVNN